METLVWVLHVLVSFTVIGLVLLQHGKGADMGAAFGSGSSGSLFGSSGSANFLSRATAVAVNVFFLTSMTLTYFALSKESKPLAAKPQTPVAPVTAPASKAPAPSLPAGSKVKEIPN